jgi:hypothetical protein
VSTVFILAGGGFMPIGFWAYRKVVLHFWGPPPGSAEHRVEVVVVRRRDIADKPDKPHAVSSRVFKPSPY